MTAAVADSWGHTSGRRWSRVCMIKTHWMWRCCSKRMKEWTWLAEPIVDYLNFSRSTWPSRLFFSPYCARWRIQWGFECRSSNRLNNAICESFFNAAAKCGCDPHAGFSQRWERKAEGFDHFFSGKVQFHSDTEFSFIYLLNKVILCSLFLITLEALWRDS